MDSAEQIHGVLAVLVPEVGTTGSVAALIAPLLVAGFGMGMVMARCRR